MSAASEMQRSRASARNGLPSGAPNFRLGTGARRGSHRAMNYLYLAVAITAEVIGTTALKASEGFTRLGPSAVVAVAYLAAFFFLSLTLRTIPVGVAYAIWSGAGIVLVTVIAWFLYNQRLDAGAIAGIALILAGVIVLNVFSKSAAH